MASKKKVPDLPKNKARNDRVDRFLKEAGIQPAKLQRAQQRYDEARGRRGKELELWHQWNDAGRKPEHLEPLLKSLEPIFRSEANKRIQGTGGSITPYAMKQELRNSAVKSLARFNPTAGAQLTTWVINGFQRTSDFVSGNRNAKYMPREDTDRYQQYQNAINDFENVHGRTPSTEELAKTLKLKPSTVKKLQRGFSSEVFSEMGTELEHDVATEDPMARIRSALLMVKSQLTPQQWDFANHHYPEEGEQQKSVQEIAKTLGIPEHKAYRIKKQVESKLSPIIKKQ